MMENTAHILVLPVKTAAQIAAMTPQIGQIVVDKTNNIIKVYTAAGWKDTYPG